MKITEELKKYRSMKDADLQAELKKISKELTLLSLKVRAGKEDSMANIKKFRKNIARINTILIERTWSNNG